MRYLGMNVGILYKIVGITGIIIVLATALAISFCPHAPGYFSPGSGEERTGAGEGTTIVYGPVAGSYYSEIMRGPSHCFRVTSGTLYNDCIDREPSPVKVSIPLTSNGGIAVINGPFILVKGSPKDIDKK